MKRHRADLVSFVFAIIFMGTVGVGVGIAVGGWDTLTAGAWLIPAAVVLFGVGVLVTTLRGASRAGD
jgi:hypothetical protein